MSAVLISLLAGLTATVGHEPRCRLRSWLSGISWPSPSVELGSPQFLDELPGRAHVAMDFSSCHQFSVLCIEQVRFPVPVSSGQVPASAGIVPHQ